MSTADARVDSTFLTHPKRVRLQRRLGPQAVLSLVDLWAWAAATRPRGILTGMDPEDIAIACGYPGDPEEFVRTLVEVGFLETQRGGKTGYTCTLHAWAERNPYAYHSEDRAARARVAAAKRWGNADSMPGASGEQCHDGRGAMPSSSSSSSSSSFSSSSSPAMPPACQQHAHGIAAPEGAHAPLSETSTASDPDNGTAGCRCFPGYVCLLHRTPETSGRIDPETPGAERVAEPHVRREPERLGDLAGGVLAGLGPPPAAACHVEPPPTREEREACRDDGP